eukprot:scaffold42731_cov24-Tisochrysis_lutea.AAC.2
METHTHLLAHHLALRPWVAQIQAGARQRRGKHAKGVQQQVQLQPKYAVHIWGTCVLVEELQARAE